MYDVHNDSHAPRTQLSQELKVNGLDLIKHRNLGKYKYIHV